MCYVKPMKMKSYLLVLFSFLLFIICFSCEEELKIGEGGRGRVVLKITEKKIYSSSFERFVAYNLGKEEITLTDYVKSRLFDDFIEEQMLLAEARKNNVLVSNSELYEAIRAMETVTGVRGDHLSKSFAECLREELTVRKYLAGFILADIAVSYQEVSEYYLANPDEFVVPEEVRVAQIFLTDEQRAKSVYRELRANPRFFPELAKKYSESPDAASGGEMGYFRRGQLPPEFERAIFLLMPGRFTSVIQSPYGYHIFFLKEKKEGGKLSEEEVRDNIRVKLMQKKSDERLSRYLAQLKKTIPIRIYTKNLDFKYIAPKKEGEQDENK
jgi:hypothetical protein